MPKTSTKKTAAQLRAQIDEFVSRQENNTFNYKQAAAAIGATTWP